MKDTRAALRYAKAILNLAKESKEDDAVNKDMHFIADTISDNKELDTLLHSPVVKASDKVKLLEALFSKKVSKITEGLFKLLKENKRIDMIVDIAKQYAIIYDFEHHIQVAKVTTAVPITEDIEKKVLAKIVELTGDQANLENIVNPDILGGFILRVGDVQYDASISNYLHELRKEFDNSHYIPKL